MEGTYCPRYPDLIMLAHASPAVPLEIDQNSEEWHAWRKRILSASRAPIIMGVAPSYWYKNSWADLRKPEPTAAEHDPATRKLFQAGHLAERRYRATLPPTWEPKCYEREVDGVLFGASLDLAVSNWGATDWIEVKSARSVRSRIWDAADPANDVKQVSPHVWWQLVHQAAVLGDTAGSCWLVIADQNDERRPLRRWIDTAQLLADWPLLLERWMLFRAGGEPGRQDLDWLEATDKFLVAKAVVDVAKGNFEEARERLIELVGDKQEVKGGGVHVSKRPSVKTDWRKAVADAYKGDDIKSFVTKYQTRTDTWVVRKLK